MKKGHKSTRPRHRLRSTAERMYWESLTPSERLAFTLGYACGKGVDFPPPDHIAALREQLGATGARTTSLRGRKIARTASGKRFTYDYAEVARIARQAFHEGRSQARAVFEEIEQCASEAAAQMAISAARKAGHDIPYVRDRTGGAA